MDGEQRTAIIEAGKETARISQAAGKLRLASDPAEFWIGRTYREYGVIPNQSDLAEGAQLAVRQVVADIMSGNLTRVGENLVGQSVWLSALAAKLAAKADQVPDGYGAVDERTKFLKLALQAQRQAVQTLCSAAALGKDGVVVRE